MKRLVELESGAIRILKPDGSTARIGFLVSKWLVVTCVHVAEASDETANKVKFTG